MEETLLHLLILIYGFCGIVTFAGYTPTIIDLLNKKPSASIPTYITWTTTMFFTTLYAVFVNKDLFFIGFVGAEFLACLIILILRLRLKYIKN